MAIDCEVASASLEVKTFAEAVYLNGILVAVSAPQLSFELHILAQSVLASVQLVVEPQSLIAAYVD